MSVLDSSEAQTNFPRLARRGEAGEEVVIAGAGVPVAELVAFEPAKPKRRQPVLMRGKIWITDDVDAPVPEVIAAAFRGQRP